MSTWKLVSLGDDGAEITIPGGESGVILGRCKETKIKDVHCSRKQVQVTVDPAVDSSKQCLVVKQLAKQNLSSVQLESAQLKQVDPGCSAKLKQDDVLFLLCDKYPFKVVSTTCNEARDFKNKSSLIKMSTNPGPTDQRIYNKTVKVAAKRKIDNSESGEESEVKKPKMTFEDVSDDEEDEIVAKKLRQLQENAAKILTSETTPVSISPGEVAQASIWFEDKDILIYTANGVRSSNKIAGFDIDGTIIRTKSGKVFPKDIQDWQIVYPEIPRELKKLTANGFKVVFFTNQGGIKKRRLKVEDLKTKIKNIVTRIGTPVQVFASKGSLKYHKPIGTMWDDMKTQYNRGVSKVDRSQSFYVGDAAGRPVNWIPGKKKDFSKSDRLFALNVGVDFHTPEEYFLKKGKASFEMPEFDPTKLDVNSPMTDSNDEKFTSSQQEVIVLVGYPGSGKSFFCKNYLLSDKYIHVNRDTLKTWQKCVQLCQKSLQQGNSVIIDNTNLDIESRKRYIECCKGSVKCRCFLFNVSFNHARHNEKFRQLTVPGHDPINEMVMYKCKNTYVEPSLKEGLTSIVKINFVPKFSSPDDEKLYRQFLLDK